MSEQTGKIVIGIDGNCGFALLGPDLQEGESEFVEVEPPITPIRQKHAAATAHSMLLVRLELPPDFPWEYHESHPCYRKK